MTTVDKCAAGVIDAARVATKDCHVSTSNTTPREGGPADNNDDDDETNAVTPLANFSASVTRSSLDFCAW